ncbi:MAG: M23 family metallopeptidase [Balneolales bacterium]
MIFNKSDREVRQSIIEISHRVMSLQDSLHTRDKQLEDLRTVLAEGSDTTFSIHPMDSMDQQEAYYENRPQSIALDPQVRIQNVDVNQIIYSRNLTGEPDFPADPPLTGTVTRIFDKDRTHMGIDIAASEGASAKVIADGVITNADWTINFGYVVHVHHGNGYISTYKHLSNLYKKKGDFIFKNDILGTVGRSGILTSGPHIHFELWRDGIALDPSLYLSNLINVN